MQSSLYIALSAQVALESRLETIAQNVANGNTPGYRSTELKFDSVMSNLNDPQVAYVSARNSFIKRGAGELVKTGNPLDVAIKGDGWLSISSPSGVAYTRDGRMRMNTSGELVTLSGAPVLDAGGSAVQLDPSAGQPEIGPNGTITQGGKRTGGLGLFMLDKKAQLTRVQGGVISSIPGTPVLDTVANGVVQGYFEQSNVNPISEITRLIYVQRTFDGLGNTIQATESSLKNAIQTLGSSS
jgi:flagellar basal-body rod protein FlgF